MVCCLLCHSCRSLVARRFHTIFFHPILHSFGQSLNQTRLKPRPIRSVADDFFNNPMFQIGHTLEARADGFCHRYSVFDLHGPPI